MPVPAIFIASPSDVDDYRAAVARASQTNVQFALRMEMFEPSEQYDIDKCRSYIDECDLFILILAHRYGSRPPGESLSFTELEFDHAKKQNKPHFAFFMDPRHPWPDERRDHDAAEVAALERFKEKVRGHDGITQYGDLSAFELTVASLLGGRRGERKGTGWAQVAGNVRLSELTFESQTFRRPQDLAERIAGSTDWRPVRRLFGGEERIQLTKWLMDDPAYREQARLLMNVPRSQAEVLEWILHFVAHYAPATLAVCDGKRAGAVDLAEDYGHLAEGRPDTRGVVGQLTEGVVALLATHPCSPRHPECEGEPGCVVLANSWARTREALTELRHLTGRLPKTVALPDPALVEAEVRAAMLDPARGNEMIARAESLADHTVTWWRDLRSAPERRAGLPAHIAHAAALLALEPVARSAVAAAAHAAAEAQRRAVAQRQEAQQRETRDREFEEQRRVAAVVASEQEAARATTASAQRWLAAIIVCGALLAALPVAFLVRATTTHLEHGPSPALPSLYALLGYVGLAALPVFANIFEWRVRLFLNVFAVLGIVGLAGANAWLIWRDGWVYAHHWLWMALVHLLWLVVVLLIVLVVSANNDDGWEFDDEGPEVIRRLGPCVSLLVLGFLPLIFLVAGLIGGGARGHVTWVGSLIVLGLGVVATILALVPWASVLAPVVVGAQLLGEVGVVGRGMPLFTGHWYWIVVFVVLALVGVWGSALTLVVISEDL